MRELWTGWFLLASIGLAAAIHAPATGGAHDDSSTVTDGKSTDHPAVVRPLQATRGVPVAPFVASALTILVAPPALLLRQAPSLLPAHRDGGSTSVSARGPPVLV